MSVSTSRGSGISGSVSVQGGTGTGVLFSVFPFKGDLLEFSTELLGCCGVSWCCGFRVWIGDGSLVFCFNSFLEVEGNCFIAATVVGVIEPTSIFFVSEDCSVVEFSTEELSFNPGW